MKSTKLFKRKKIKFVNDNIKNYKNVVVDMYLFGLILLYYYIIRFIIILISFIIIKFKKIIQKIVSI